jgi:uncharacterized LabA/DUF88 family protein
MIRVVSYIDGFNIYHAIDDMSRATRGKLNYLKWVDLQKLMTVFTDPKVHTMISVKYFSAYATWLTQPYKRHQQYVAALKHSGVEVIMGQFKEKEIYCKTCKTTFKGHEEKESDVNIACHLLSDAYDDIFDQAIIVSRDSDLSSPIRFVQNRFPIKKVKVIAPPKRGHSKELWALANTRAAIKQEHLEKCLFPASANGRDGKPIYTRPPEYGPPVS